MSEQVWVMLIDALTDHFQSYFDRTEHHDTVLWFDPQGEWTELVPHLQERVELLLYEGSFLRLRHELARRPPGTSAVVYLPMSQEQANLLRPYFFTSKLYEATIESVLRGEGIRLPEAPEERRAVQSLLPLLALRSIGQGRAFWEGIFDRETALGHLIVDLDDLLLRTLAQLDRTMADLDRQSLRGPFFDLVSLRFGASRPGPGEEDAWADRLTAMLCLVATYGGCREAAGFPFMGALPEPVHWGRCRSFLSKWQHHELFRDAFRRRAVRLDADYPLGAWVTSLDDQPALSTFLNVARAQWDAAQRELERVLDKEEAISFARRGRDLFRRQSQGFWARQGEVPGWETLALMADMILGANEALDELDGYETASAMVDRYAERWWQVDRSYRRFRARIDLAVLDLDVALKWTDRIYQEYLERINVRFSQEIMDEGVWPPAGQRVGMKMLWVPRDQSATGQRAILLVDALRYELARDLVERLGVGSTQVDARVSPVPSITALGMAAVLPRWSELNVNYTSAEWVVTPPTGGANLALKSKRLAWLTENVGSAQVLDLDRWLVTPIAELDASSAWIVISTTMIDAIGEGAGFVALQTFDALLHHLEQGIRRLLAAGCMEIHVVTDHGFLLREAIAESDKVEVDAPGVLGKQERYLVGRDLPPTDLPHLPVSGSRDLVAWFPCGVACFATPGAYNYMHGGLSLQEVVVPHVTVRQSVAYRPVNVALELVDGPEIRNAIFRVRLIPQDVDLFTRSRRVEIDMVAADQRVSRVWEERIEREVVERALMVEPEYGLGVGDEIRVRVRDATTGQLLSEQAAIIMVDLLL